MYLLFTRLQNATEVDATCSLPPDPVVGTDLTPLIINHKKFTMEYRGAYYKAQDITVKIIISISYTLLLCR